MPPAEGGGMEIIMNIGVWSCIILVIPFLIIGVLFAIFKEKAAKFVSGFNSFSKEEQAQKRFERIVEQMAESEGITEQLKATDQVAWVGEMNNIWSRAREVVNAELIYN